MIKSTLKHVGASLMVAAYAYTIILIILTYAELS